MSWFKKAFSKPENSKKEPLQTETTLMEPPPPEQLIPLTKLLSNIEKITPEFSGKMVVLVSTGSYSPIHRMHVHMFEVAKKALEEKHGYKVVAGFASPSHDHYVESKLGDKYLHSSHRMKLCEFSTSESEWISLSKWEMSQNGFVDYPSVARFHTQFISEKFPGKPIKVMYLCGADHALRCRLYNCRTFSVVAVGRPTYSSQLREVAAAKNDQFVLVEDETEDISSTEIRKRLENNTSIDDLMHPEAASYLMSVYSKPKTT